MKNILKRVLNTLITILPFLFIVYLSFSYVFENFNMFEWCEQCKNNYTTFVIFSYILVFCLESIFND